MASPPHIYVAGVLVPSCGAPSLSVIVPLERGSTIPSRFRGPFSVGWIQDPRLPIEILEANPGPQERRPRGGREGLLADQLLSATRCSLISIESTRG